MKEEALQKRLEELREIIQEHNYRYHVLDEPVISDHEFDQLMSELLEIEREHPEWVSPDSPSQRVGGEPAEKFDKVEHPAPILSLSNAFDAEELRAWLERVGRVDERALKADFVVEPKLDGLSVVLHFRDGLFVQGATRGNGEVGEDVTVNLRTVSALPLRIPVRPDRQKPPPNLVVRGEVFITKEDFVELNKRQAEEGEKTYVNPRNTAAGALRQLDSSITADRPLSLLCYAIVTGEGDLPATQWETLQYLQEMGFPVSDEAEFCEDIECVVASYEHWVEKREALSYEIDGLVVKINDHTLVGDLGTVGRAPRGAIAFKFPAREVTTDLLDIGVNVGRTGVLTPYAVLEPVEIGGVVVKQATLHNFDFIEEKDIRVGDRVLVKRAGDVIPYVIGPVEGARTGKEKPYRPPETCPVCGEPVEHREGEVAWYCVNSACPAQLVRTVEHFVGRGTLDIVGLGYKIVQQLVEEGLIEDVADLYTLERDELLALEGFAEKKADNLLEAIEVSKSQPLWRLIFALGIRGVGEVVARDLSRNFQDLDALSRASVEDLEAIEGIGPNIAEDIVEWFARPSNQKVLEKLRAIGMWPETEIASAEEGELPLDDLTFVITGALQGFSRREAKDFIESKGGRVTSSVSGNTDYLLVGENPGSKLDQAQDLGVKILDEGGLRELLESRSRG